MKNGFWNEQTRQKISDIIFLLAIFFLPWQTMFIFGSRALLSGETQYGNFALYAVECLIVIAVFLRGLPIFQPNTNKIMRAGFFFFAAAFLSLAFSKLFSIGVITLWHMAVAGFLFLYVCDTRTRIDRVIFAFVLGLVIPSGLGWFQYLSGFSPASTWFGLAQKDASTVGIAVVMFGAGRWLRAYGSFPHPNIFGGYLAVGLLLFGLLMKQIVCHCEGGQRPKQSFRKDCFACIRDNKWIITLLVVLLSSTLIITFSRSAWLAFFIAFAILVFSFLKNRYVFIKSQKIFTIIMLATFILTIFIWRAQVFSRFDPSLHIESISIAERQSQYQMFPRVFAMDPFFGIGPGSYVFALESLYPEKPSWSYQPIHNSFLLLLTELGGVGFFALAYFFFEISRRIWLRRKSFQAIFAIALIVELFIFALFDHYLFSLWSGLVLAALVLAITIRFSEEMETVEILRVLPEPVEGLSK